MGHGIHCIHHVRETSITGLRIEMEPRLLVEGHGIVLVVPVDVYLVGTLAEPVGSQLFESRLLARTHIKVLRIRPIEKIDIEIQRQRRNFPALE